MATATNIMSNSEFTAIEGRGTAFYTLLVMLVIVAGLGLWAAHYMDVAGHHVTGMSNQIVWGIPHVFAIFLIVTASGALNAASLSTVMGWKVYTPYARLSGLLAIALLLGGLAIITLDLGRPERLMVALTHFNFTSVFAWNVFLYTGFLVLVSLYLWTLMERRMNPLSKSTGTVLLAWRLTLTTGTGLIFGVLVARQAYDTAIMPPLFIAMSLCFGSAAYTLLLFSVFDCSGRRLDDAVVSGLRRLLVLCVVGVLFFVGLLHGVKLYTPESRSIEAFLLVSGGVYPWFFWAGQIVAGSLVPLGLMLWRPTARSRSWFAAACALVLLGGLAQLYVIVIGGQAYPLDIFPGRQIIESSFFDGTAAEYQPRLPEFLLAFGGVAMALLIIVLGMRVLRFLPRTRTAD
jgi:molybdopterin-containing oxidoreductase family membrane subunit